MKSRENQHHHLKTDSHVQYILSVTCAQRLYLLNVLKHPGMPAAELHIAAHFLIVMWGGFLPEELVVRLMHFYDVQSNLAITLGFRICWIKQIQTCSAARCRPYHCLVFTSFVVPARILVECDSTFSPVSAIKSTVYIQSILSPLCTRPHEYSFSLPHKKYKINTHKNSFVVRKLYISIASDYYNFRNDTT